MKQQLNKLKNEPQSSNKGDGIFYCLADLTEQLQDLSASTPPDGMPFHYNAIGWLAGQSFRKGGDDE